MRVKGYVVDWNAIRSYLRRTSGNLLEVDHWNSTFNSQTTNKVRIYFYLSLLSSKPSEC